MARVTVLGIGPLEFEGPNLYTGSANRVWQLAKPLFDCGHKLTLVCMRATGSGAETPTCEKQRIHERITYIPLDEVGQFDDDEVLQKVVDSTWPDVIVAANVYPAARAAVLKRKIPLWVDLNGYTMGEAQCKAYREQEDGYVVHFYDILRQALSRGDAYSVCSNRYREGAIGELTMLGRDVPPEDVYVIHEAKEPPVQDQERIREFRRKVAADDEFVVLWSGGYNTWADVVTMFEALEFAMRENLKIRFLSTGGAIPGHDEKTYPAFLERIEASPYKERFTLLGWIAMADAQIAFHAADAGINVDRDCYETLLGARNRITEMLATGLVPVTTLGSEITEIVEREGLGWVTPTGDAEALGKAILEAAADPEERTRRSQKAKAFAQEHYTYEACARELVFWVQQMTMPVVI